MAISRSSRDLDSLLDEGGSEADAIKGSIHRTVLWRYRKGKGKPDADTVALLERLSSGRVQANGWEDETPEAGDQSRCSDPTAA